MEVLNWDEGKNEKRFKNTKRTVIENSEEKTNLEKDTKIPPNSHNESQDC